MKNTRSAIEEAQGVPKYTDRQAASPVTRSVSRTVTQLHRVITTRTEVLEGGVCVFVFETRTEQKTPYSDVLRMHRETVDFFDEVRQC